MLSPLPLYRRFDCIHCSIGFKFLPESVSHFNNIKDTNLIAHSVINYDRVR